MKTTVWYLLVICLIKVKEMVNYIFAEMDKTNKIQRKVKNWRRREETLDTKTGKNNAQWKIWEGGKRYEAKNREDVTSGEQQLLFLLFNTCLQRAIQNLHLHSAVELVNIIESFFMKLLAVCRIITEETGTLNTC